MEKHLVIVGAGHVHLTVLKNLRTFIDQGHKVTVVSSGAYHYYSGMGPGMLSGLYHPEEIRFHVQKMVEDRGGIFIEDKVVKIDPDKKQVYLQAGQEIGYDVISFNTGSLVSVEQEMQPAESVFAVKPIENLLQARMTILEKLQQKKKVTVTIAGGGAAGIEMAANTRTLVERAQGKADIYLIAGDRLIARFAEKVRTYVLTSLTSRHITVREGVKLQSFKNGVVELSEGSSFESDVVMVAVGTRPSPMFADSGLPTGEGGGLLVNEYLQSVEYPEIFGGGDCIAFKPRPLEKIGIYAVRQNPILLHNLLAALNEEAYQKFVPQTSFMLILNMGDGTGIVFRNSLVWKGKLAFLLKNYIDTTFMRKFQVSGEREK